MKKIFLLIAVLFFTISAFSQTDTKNNFRIGGGSAFFGSGDVIGYTFYNSYNRVFLRNFSLENALNFSYGSRKQDKTY